MKVILLTDVKNVGKKGQVVEVSDSYARNVLIKKNQGLEATGKNMNDLKLQKANDEKVAAQNLADARVLAEQIEKSSIVLKVKVGEGGKLFGSHFHQGDRGGSKGTAGPGSGQEKNPAHQSHQVYRGDGCAHQAPHESDGPAEGACGKPLRRNRLRQKTTEGTDTDGRNAD